ncbi:MAG: hypothetical protein L0215_16775 [Gemmataceae bacterium]|nr:hypothetical protein [Gemmataceae bacterium]
MKQRFVSFALAIAVALGFVQWARAQGKEKADTASISVIEGDCSGCGAGQFRLFATRPLMDSPLFGWMGRRDGGRDGERRGIGCYAHHNELGCGSFCSEMTFIFGSCRTFFGEQCIPNPPHFPRRR